jgi:hypothetical protein
MLEALQVTPHEWRDLVTASALMTQQKVNGEGEEDADACGDH